MKMENVLCSPVDGIIKEILVNTKQTVEKIVYSLNLKYEKIFNNSPNFNLATLARPNKKHLKNLLQQFLKRLKKRMFMTLHLVK